MVGESLEMEENERGQCEVGGRSTMIDTRNVKRRSVVFHGIDDVLQELDRIEAANRTGTLCVTGNWQPGTILAHLAAWIRYGYEGYPMKPPPWLFGWLIRRMGRRYLSQGMPSGMRIPGPAEGTYGVESVSTEEGLARLRHALERLRNEPARFPSPTLGPLSQAELVRLHLRHAELHLSFIEFRSALWSE